MVPEDPNVIEHIVFGDFVSSDYNQRAVRSDRDSEQSKEQPGC